MEPLLFASLMGSLSYNFIKPIFLFSSYGVSIKELLRVFLISVIDISLTLPSLPFCWMKMICA